MDYTSGNIVYFEEKSFPSSVPLVRHHYFSFRESELHTGMSETICPKDTYKPGRVESRYLMCNDCVEQLTNKVLGTKFFLPLTNCDFITGQGIQTVLMWVCCLSLIAGLFYKSLYLVVALIVLVILIVYNYIPCFIDQWYICPHIDSQTRKELGASFDYIDTFDINNYMRGWLNLFKKRTN